MTEEALQEEEGDGLMKGSSFDNLFVRGFLFCIMLNTTTTAVTAQDRQKFVQIRQITQPPIIDGLIDDECWKNIGRS